MRLRCVARYSSSLGQWKPGQEFDINDALGQRLLRDSPGSFEQPDVASRVAEHTEPTATDVQAPDRQARGGRKR